VRPRRPPPRRARRLQQPLEVLRAFEALDHTTVFYEGLPRGVAAPRPNVGRAARLHRRRRRRLTSYRRRRGSSSTGTRASSTSPPTPPTSAGPHALRGARGVGRARRRRYRCQGQRSSWRKVPPWSAATCKHKKRRRLFESELARSAGRRARAKTQTERRLRPGKGRPTRREQGLLRSVLCEAPTPRRRSANKCTCLLQERVERHTEDTAKSHCNREVHFF